MNAMQSPGKVVQDSRIAQIASGAGWVLIALGLSVLAGWAFHLHAAVTIVPRFASMKANTALAFLLAGVALLRRGARDVSLYSLGVLIMGAATLTEYLSNANFGIDQLLFRDPYSIIDPGRMSVLTAVGFSVLGSGLLLASAQSVRARQLSRSLGLLTGTIGFIALLGYSYDVRALYQVRPYSGMSLHTAVGFLTAAIGLQCVYPREGIMRQVHADTAGGAMLRRLFLAALLIPFLLGFAAWFAHERLGLGLGFAMAVVVAGITFCLASIILRNAGHLEQRDLALHRATRELEEAQRLARVGNWLWDPAKGIIYWSEELYRIHARNPDLPPPSHEELPKLFTPESWSRLNVAIEKALQTSSVQEIHLELVRPDGSKRLITARGEAVGDGNCVAYLRGTAQDVTEQKEILQRLHESEERFRRVVEHIGDALFVDDAAGRVVFANDQFLNLFGFRRDELQNITLEDYVAPEYRAQLRDRHHRRIRGEAMPSQFEYEGCRRDGTRIWLEVDVVPVKAQDGKLIGTQSALRDITARRQAEQVLRESEERFRLVANAAPVLIWMSGPDKLCNYFNQTWLEFTGRPFEAELGNGWSEAVHAEDLKACLDTYTQAFDRHESFKMQYRLRRNDGEYRWVLDIGVPRFNCDGTFAGYIGSCVDVTDHKLAEEALSNVNRSLIEAQEEERTRIARELHDDINQQLALLAIALDQLKQELPRSLPQLRGRIEELQNRTSAVSSDIQTLSHRLHSSKLEYLGLVAAAKGFCGEFSEQHHVEVAFEHQQVPSSLPKDISLCLFRVLQAALANALKHSGVRRYEVLLSGTANGIHLTVRDHGIGFDLEKVLSGHGIGLISMRERVRLVNGKISIQSRPDRGTTIDIDVPLSIGSSNARSVYVA